MCSDIAKWLRTGAEFNDRAIFNAWSRREMTTDQTIKKFRYNNMIPENVEISREDFRNWVNSLGYRRTSRYE